jgi:murein DD-endopeptidase MepM/ murein hydrolase activator NlpD
MANRARIRLFVAILVVLSALVAFIWLLSRKTQTEQVSSVTPLPANASTEATPVREQALPSPSPSPGVEPTAQPTPLPIIENAPLEPTPTPQPLPTALPESSQLLVPVAGVRPEQLRDTFTDARSEGRSHDAIDIAAPRGTPVLAATDGRIVKLFQSVQGGITIYQLGTDNRTIYYYAHLERYVEGLKDGYFARRGEVIGYVGDTGNAGAGNYHLHFSVSIVSDPRRYWEGTNINPYPLLVTHRQ